MLGSRSLELECEWSPIETRQKPRQFVSRTVTRKTRISRAHRDATSAAERFARENGAAITAVRDFFNWRMQHVLSLRLDAERQRFMQRNRDLDPEIATRIWFDVCEAHPGTSLVMADLEYERDKREGRAHEWKRHSWAGGAATITGPQLSFDEAQGIA